MRKLVYRAIALLFLYMPGEAATDSALAREAEVIGGRLMRAPWASKLSDIPETKREAVIDFFREHIFLSEAHAVLIRLGDRRVRQEAIDEFRARRLRPEVLEDCGDPTIIVEIIDFALIDEPVRIKVPDDVAVYPQSVDASNVILKILSTTPEIPEGTRKWAADVLRSRGSFIKIARQNRAAVRAWWPQNKDALLRGDYAGLKPLEGPIPEEPSTPKPVTPPSAALPKASLPVLPSPPATPAGKGAIPIAAPTIPASPRLEKSPTTTPREGAPTRWWWLASALAIVILAGAILRRRR